MMQSFYLQPLLIVSKLVLIQVMALLDVSAWPGIVCDKQQFYSTMSFPGGAAAAEQVHKELCAAARNYSDLPQQIINTLSFKNLMTELVDPVCGIFFVKKMCGA